MSEDKSQSQAKPGSGVVISQAMREKHPELIDLIVKSESMNDGERQYWIDLLPVMTQEQITQLQTILQNERDQLAAIDEKYGKQMKEISDQQKPLQKIEDDRRARALERSAKEREHAAQEQKSAEDILKDIGNV